MAYCTHTDVSILLQFTGGFGLDSQPTAIQVTDIIAMIEGTVNSALDTAGIVLPLSNTNFISMIKQICIKGAAGYVHSSYYKNGNMDGTSGNYFYQEYKEFLQDLEDNPTKYLSMANPTANIKDVSPSNNITSGYLKESDLSFLSDVRF